MGAGLWRESSQTLAVAPHLRGSFTGGVTNDRLDARTGPDAASASWSSSAAAAQAADGTSIGSEGVGFGGGRGGGGEGFGVGGGAAQLAENSPAFLRASAVRNKQVGQTGQPAQPANQPTTTQPTDHSTNPFIPSTQPSLPNR
eukprot:362353-Chlamydomonas_euryale.AAC.3